MIWECGMLSQYNKSTQMWRYNDVYNALTEVSLSAHSALVKERADHLPVVKFAEDNMDANRYVPVVNLLPVRFIGYPTR